LDNGFVNESKDSDLAGGRPERLVHKDQACNAWQLSEESKKEPERITGGTIDGWDDEEESAG
jgi:hypothetical protein